MRNRFIYRLFNLVILLSFIRCAQIVPLSGGKKDTSAPKLIEAVPSLNSKQFNTNVITLKFDEFVQLKDLSNQLIVTPRLKTEVELNASGKKIEIKLKKEELKPNTTYRIFIGKAIADMTESNSIENFEYVFSTGDKMDTLQLKGNISDAFTNNPSVSMLIGLYSNIHGGDSLVFNEKPDYYTRTNDNGEFILKNLPAGTFRVYGISDLNKNEKYDGETERIAFLSSPLQLQKDTGIKLKMFQEESPKVFIKKTSFPLPGFFQIQLNKPSLVKVTSLREADKLNLTETAVGKLKDTVSLYYKNIQDTLALVVSNKISNRNDTLKLAIPKKGLVRRTIKNFNLNTTSDKLALNSNLKISFPNWMDTSTYNLSKIRLTSKEDSSIAKEVLTGRWTSITAFEFGNTLKEGLSYTLKIDSTAFFDINHQTNDSALFNFALHSKTDFGKVRLKLKLNKKQAYIVQLLNEQNQISKEQLIQFSLSSSNSTSIDFIDVLPGTYTVKIIFDNNNNQKWDRGDVILKKLPEEVIINSKQLKVLSEWEIEEEITIRE